MGTLIPNMILSTHMINICCCLRLKSKHISELSQRPECKYKVNNHSRSLLVKLILDFSIDFREISGTKTISARALIQRNMELGFVYVDVMSGTLIYTFEGPKLCPQYKHFIICQLNTIQTPCKLLRRDHRIRNYHNTVEA